MSGRAPAAWMLSSAGRRGSLVQILRQHPIDGEAVVVATDASPLSAAGQLADVFALVPPVRHEGFVERTLAIAIEHGVRVIIPTIDPEIEVFAEHRARFDAHGIDVWVSAPFVARLGWDKWRFAQWLEAEGLPTVATAEVRDLAGVTFDGPVVAKPRHGSSGHGVILADALGDLALGRLDDDYIVQSRAPGVEITVDVAVARDGHVLGIVPRRRIEVRGGEVSKGVTVDEPAVIEVVRSLASRLPGAYGVLNVQVFLEAETGRVSVIEINPRFGGGYPLTHHAGADLVDALLRHGRGETVPEATWRPGTLMLRYDAETIVHDVDPRTL